jgi:hypothetical protein
MMKYASNTWHALKVTFANEIGNVCKRVGIDSHEVMNIFCKDEKLNLSSYYMKPGFAFGGSCLPKDVRALQYRAKEVDLDMPVIQAILGSNQLQIQHAIDEIVRPGKKRARTVRHQLQGRHRRPAREPHRHLAEALLGKGFSLCIYDRNVSLARLVGANKDYINQQIPHLSSLLQRVRSDEVLDKSDVIVVGNAGAGNSARRSRAPARTRSCWTWSGSPPRASRSKGTIGESAGNLAYEPSQIENAQFGPDVSQRWTPTGGRRRACELDVRPPAGPGFDRGRIDGRVARPWKTRSASSDRRSIAL